MAVGLNGPSVDSAESAGAVAWYARADRNLNDVLIRGACLVAAVLPLAALIFITAVMLWAAYPAVIYSGLQFFTGHVFSFGNLYAAGAGNVHNGISAPPGAQYGAATLIAGTLLTSVIAVVVGVPVAVGAVFLLVELPRWIQDSLSVILELLASIPSVVFGLWGILTLGPTLARTLYPALTQTLGRVFPFFAGPTGYGQGLMTAGLVLAIMIIPIVAATTRELIRTVPVLTREGAVALGLTRLEVLWVVALPFIRGGILAAALLGWARALGETMAVLMISGNALNIFPQTIYAPGSTLAATIAAMLDAALTDATGMGTRALAELGLVLLVITLATNFLGRLVVRRFSSAALPIGRGV